MHRPGARDWFKSLPKIDVKQKIKIAQPYSFQIGGCCCQMFFGGYHLQEIDIINNLRCPSDQFITKINGAWKGYRMIDDMPPFPF